MKLEDWIEENRISAKYLQDNVIEVDGFGQLIILEHKDGLVFSEEFNFILSDDEMDLLDSTPSIQYFLFLFGKKWYYSNIEEISLRLFRYLGNSNVELKLEDFPFLGIHGKYEVLNGSKDYMDWCKKAKFLGYSSLGICEKNTLGGTLHFQNACKSNKIKSILGETVTVLRGEDIMYDIKLYAINKWGWRNLLNINKIINVDNLGSHISEGDLFRYSSDLVCILTHYTPLSDELIIKYNEEFEEVFYQLDSVEWKSNDRDLKYLEKLNDYFKNFIQFLPPILINDAYYLDKSDSITKILLNKIQKGSSLEQSDDQYMKSIDDNYMSLSDLFSNEEEFEKIFNTAIENAILVGQKCDFKIDTGKFYIPKYEMSEEQKKEFETNNDLFFYLVQVGFESKISGRVGDREREYMERIEFEIDIINQGGFIDYFLITWEMCEFADKNNIFRNLGRGSAAGSLVLYLLGVTKIDPIKYNLYFERFLNPSRILEGMPDIDSDYESEGRELVKQYLVNKYGVASTCYVGTYGVLKVKSLIKDVAKIHGIPFHKINYITSTLPKKVADELKDVSDLFKYSSTTPPLKEFIQNNGKLINNLDGALGAIRSRGVHAAATMIFPKEIDGVRVNIWDLIPVRLDNNIMVSEIDGAQLDKMGFLKNDILGLEQLDKVKKIFGLIKKNHNIDLVMEEIPLDDKLTYWYFQNGYMMDVFQFNGDGMSGYLKELVPDNIEDLIATNALYRPGTMDTGGHKKYIEIKHGRKEPEYLFKMEEVTNNTFGILCIAENSLVLTNRGQEKIQNVKIGDLVLTENGEYNKVTNVINNEIRDTIKLRTSFGEELICTPDHKVLTQDGWKRVADLSKKDLIKSFWVEEERFEYGNVRDWILGIFLANGNSGGSPSIACSSKEFAYILADIISKEFELENCRVYFHTRTWHVSLGHKSGYINPFNSFLKELGLFKKTGKNKFLPKNYTLSTLIGFIEGDGCLFNNTIRLTNKQLAYEIYKGFQAYRINSSYYQQFEGKTEVYTTVFNDDQRRIKYIIKNFDRKFKKVYVPRKYILPYKDFFTKNNISIQHFSNKAIKNRPLISREIVKRLNITIEHETWAKVLSIKTNKKTQVYDLSIDKVHSFVVGGLVVHNCYQEQVLKIVQTSAGFSLAEADIIRRAIGKKNMDLMQSYKDQFISGCIKNGAPKGEPEQLWALIVTFANYSFNRSHSACYAILGYITAYLKANYPVEFYTTAFQFADDKIVPKIVSEIHKIGEIKVLPPDINNSTFEIVGDHKKKKIYWSLRKIKYCGNVAVKNILEERNVGGQFFSFEEFFERSRGKKINKKALLNMILAGCFDQIENIKHPSDRLKIVRKFRDIMKIDLPPEFSDPIAKHDYYWSKLAKSLTGFGYIDFKQISDKSSLSNLTKFYIEEDDLFSEDSDKKYALVCGQIIEIKERKSKNGPFCQIQMSMNYNSIYCTIWNDKYVEFWDQLKDSVSKVIVIYGQIKMDNWKKQNVLMSIDKTKIEVI